MQTEASKYVITREDLNVDPVTLVAEGLKIGRLPSCELVLNHPMVSRLHAGINEAGGRFYLYNFSNSSGTTLNGRVVALEEAEALADGDVIQIGPFFLHIGRSGDGLQIRVVLEVAVNVGEAAGRVDMPLSPPEHQPAAGRASEDSSELAQALNVFWEKRKREAGKMQRVSPLRPQKPMRVLGKARFNWTPTRDLVRPWPFSLFTLGAVIVGVLSVVAAVAYTNAYSPAPISSAHATGDLRVQPAIAREPNAGSCTTCHTLTASMESNCSSCHQAEGFVSTVTEPHRAAGIGCTDCHIEHQGTEYRPSVASIQTCTECHNDANKRLYNGKRVGTPHGGTVGYPTVNGQWVWSGLEPGAWERKPAEMREALVRMDEAAKRWPTAGDAASQRRSVEFHVLHLHRVKVVNGLEGNQDGEVSCSTCHKSFSPIDRETPRSTCGACHSGDPDGKFRSVLAADSPNCNSCHNQHIEGRRTWGASLLAAKDDPPPFVQSAAGNPPDRR